MSEAPVFSVTEFVAVFNQTLEYAYPIVTIVGELANYRVSKDKWIYFDLKDDESNIHCFGSVFRLPGPLKDGLMLRVSAVPRLHPQYGFSLTVQHIELSGEGSIKQAAELLKAKLNAEGLFEPSRKRQLPYPPQQIGLITSAESAAYHDFVKILSDRWGGLEITLADVQVQGEIAETQIITAINNFGQMTYPPEVLIITRGGGSPEDLQVFNTEMLTRAVAASRIPTLVAIGHERDVSLAELAADQRASTPSNAAELLVPDRTQLLKQLAALHQQIRSVLNQRYEVASQQLTDYRRSLETQLNLVVKQVNDQLAMKRKILQLLDPQTILQRGYSIIHKGTKVIKSATELHQSDEVSIQFHDGHIQAKVHNRA